MPGVSPNGQVAVTKTRAHTIAYVIIHNAFDRPAHVQEHLAIIPWQLVPMRAISCARRMNINKVTVKRLS